MKLNLVTSWVAYALGLVAVALIAMFVVAIASGFEGWALIAGFVCIGLIGLGLGFVAGVVRHDRHLHRELPKFVLPGEEERAREDEV